MEPGIVLLMGAQRCVVLRREFGGFLWSSSGGEACRHISLQLVGWSRVVVAPENLQFAGISLAWK